MSTRSVDIVIKAHDRASKKFKKVSRSVHGMGRRLKSVSRIALGTFSFAMNSVKKVAIGSAAAIGLVSYGVTKVTQSYAGLQDQLSMVSTMLDETTMRFLPQYEKQLRNMSVGFGESTATLAKGLYDTLSASIDAAKAMGVVEVSVKAATAGMTDTAIAADAITTIINSYGFKAEDAAMVSDKLFAIVKRGKITFEQLAPNIGKVASLASTAGLSFDELGAAISTLTRAGLPAEIAITSVRSLLNAFLKPAKESIQVARKYGFEMNSATLKTMGLVGVLQKLKAASPEEIAELIPNIRGMAGFAASIKQADGQLKDLNLMMNSAGRTQEAFLKRTGTLKFLWKQVNQGWIESKTIIGQYLEPAVFHLGLTFKEMFKDFKDWSLSNESTIKEWSQNIKKALESAIDKMRGFVDFMKTDWASGTQWVMDSFLSIIQAAFKDAIVMAFSAGKAIFQSIKKGIGVDAKSEIGFSAMQLFKEMGGKPVAERDVDDQKKDQYFSVLNRVAGGRGNRRLYINGKTMIPRDQKDLYEQAEQRATEQHIQESTADIMKEFLSVQLEYSKEAAKKIVDSAPFKPASAPPPKAELPRKKYGWAVGKSRSQMILEELGLGSNQLSALEYESTPVNTSEAGQKAIESLKEQVKLYGMSANAIAVYKAELAGATQEEIRNMQVLLWKLKALDDEKKATDELREAQKKAADELREAQKKQLDTAKSFAQTVKDMLKTPADRFKEVQAQLKDAKSKGFLTDEQVYAARNKYAGQIFGEMEKQNKGAPTYDMGRFLTMAPPELRTDPSVRIATSQLNTQNKQLVELQNLNKFLGDRNSIPSTSTQTADF